MLICSDQMAEGDGFSLCRRASQSVPDLRVLMVLTHADADTSRALRSGAMAVVCEEDFLSPEMVVMQSLLAVANNKQYVSSKARSRMQEPEPIVDSPDSLTQREKEILILLLRGASDREISEQLLISLHTVKEYGKSIRRKYQIQSRLQLISAPLLRGQEASALQLDQPLKAVAGALGDQLSGGAAIESRRPAEMRAQLRSRRGWGVVGISIHHGSRLGAAVD